MEDTYAIEIPEYKQINKDFCLSKQGFIVSFDGYYAEFGSKTRRITVCCVIENPQKKIYTGGAIRNPSDVGYNPWIGRGLAYKRAVLQLWMIWRQLDRTGMDFNHFWQLFRKVLGKNELYLKDRKEE